MSRVFRVYRRLTDTQYKDVFALDEADALKQVTSPVGEWTTTDMHHISDKLVTKPNNPVQGYKLFLDRDIKDMMEQV